jgi:hypothetical protein
MTMTGQRMTADDFNNLFDRFEHEAFRLETLPVYTVEQEQPYFAAWLAGTVPPLDEVPYFVEWQNSIRAATAAGRRISRVRVVEEPPTPYQRFEVWGSQWTAAAGEVLRYMPRSRAETIGLPLGRDWWLFDSQRLAVMDFDPTGRPLGGTIITDKTLIDQHCAWRDLAIRHATSSMETAA